PHPPWLEVEATLDAGEVRPGMFLHIPMNCLLNLTVSIAAVEPAGARLRLELDCDDELDADLVAGFNFEGETLWVLEIEER
ncbi:hypothetical protein, partial [Alienimonas sp. DA493]|uniref:hypothetical protein n=1 Tax=Alienimonas sp. DA493 TaxID=3373605 RepID=UPI00375474E2